MPATQDRVPELPSIFHNPNLDSWKARSRTKDETRNTDKSNLNSFVVHVEQKAALGKMPVHFGFSNSWSQRRLPYSIVSLLLVLSLASTVLAQNTNPLVPTIDNPPVNPLVEDTTINIECKLILTTDLPAQFPLSWSGARGLPQGATTQIRTDTDSVATRYYSTLTFDVTAPVNFNTLTCNALTPTNSGSVSFQPFVILKPDQPTIEGPTTVNAGDVHQWTCTSDGASLVSPNVYWRNGQGEALLVGVNHSTPIRLDTYLNRLHLTKSVLTKALPPERVDYLLQCVIIHENNEYSFRTETSLSVTVLFPPQITKTSGDTVLTTESVKTTLSCVISASSPAASSVSWTKDGQPLDFSSGRYEVVSLRSPSLVITQAQKSDAGDYVCTASNLEGSNSFDTPTTLVVRYGPRITYPQGTNFDTSLGATFTLACPVDAIPDPTTIRWKRVSNTGQETYLNIGIEARYSGSTPSSSGLTISPVQADDQGSYACEAVNDVGTGTAPTITLTVNTRPGISTPQTSVSAEENSATTLTCDVTPLSSLTSLTWLKAGVTLDTSDPAKYGGGSRFQPSLTIRSLADSDSGNYACVAENAYGISTSSTITLSVTYAPRLSVNSVTVTASRGETIVLTCGVDANPTISSLYWTRVNTGVTIDPTANPQKYTGGSAGSRNLIIFGAESSDTGQYACVAENSVGITTSSAVTVSVTALPQVVIGPPTTITVTEGASQTTLQCTVSGNPAANSVYWLRDGNLLDTAASPGKYSGSTLSIPSLTIRNLNRADAGQYVCAAANDIGATNSERLVLTVTYRPTLTVPTQPITRAAGSTIALTCAVSANPSVTDFYWTRIDPTDGNTIRISAADNPAKYFGGTLADAGTLYILSSENSDSGSYRCTATNSVGTTASDLVTVSVTSIPQVTVQSPPSSVTEGTSQLTLTCSVTSNPEPTSVSWLKDGAVLETGNNPVKYQGSTVQSPSLTIRDVDRADSGAYTCVVVNSEGTGSSPAVQLNVVYRPTLTVSNTPLSTGEGGTIVLTCTVDANPAILSFYWSKAGQGRISSASNPTKYGGGTLNDQSLLIFSATSTDSGQYFCSANNNIGTADSAVVTVSVTNVPTVTTSSQTTVTVAEGTAQYILTCTVTATPAATDIYWTRAGTGRLDTENSGTTDQGLSKLSGGTVDNPSLVIRSVDRNDADAYTCVARNSIGTGVSPAVTLTVTYRPTLTVSRTNVQIQAGSSTLLSCGVSAVPAVDSLYWTKDSVRIDSSQNPSKYNGGTISVPSLTLFNADVTSDPGSYTCVARNSIGIAFSDPVNLVVTSSPLTNNGSNINTTRGEQVTLYCATKISNTNTSTIINDLYWTKNGVRLSSPPEVMVRNRNRKGGNILFPDVTFDPVTPEDAGLYSCVVVTAEEMLMGENLTLEVNQAEGTANVTLPCSIQSSPPVNDVYWLRDGLRLDTQAQTTKYSGGTPDDPDLTIFNVDRDDHATYFCIGVNQLGQGKSQALNFHVSYIPTITTDQGPITAKNGTSVTLTCAVAAYPEPSIFYWRKDGITLKYPVDPEKYRGGDLVQTSLTILEVSASEDAGMYSCVAENEEGVSTSSGVKLEIEVAPPIITTPPASATGREGVSLTLPCGITFAGSLQELKWQRNGVDLDVSDSARYAGGSVSNPSLTLVSPSDTDSGTYRCVATNQYGTSTGGDSVLDIQYRPRLIVATDPISTNPGSAISLTCQVNANPAPTSLFWTKRGAGQIVATASNKYVGGTTANPTLIITNTEIADAGNYFCTVTNNIGTTQSSDVVLRVITIPAVSVSPPSAVIQEETPSLILGCTVIASPAATLITWTKDGNIIDTASGTTSGTAPKYAGATTLTPSLTINDVRRTDAGIYACAATNTEGVGTSSNLRVDVTYVPTLTVPTTPVTGPRRGLMVLTCGVEAFPPLTSIKWVKDGSDVDLALRTSLGQNKYSGGTLVTPDLTINDLNETIDTGVYRCVAENARGVATSGPVQAAVTFDPVITVPPSVTARAGDSSFTIPCDIQMFLPATSVTWYKDNAAFNPAASPTKYLGGTLSVPALTVLSPAGSDSGSYKCQASNGQGTDITSTDVPVTVTFAPQITASTTLVTRDRGQSVTLQVTVDAIPSASGVQWQTSDIDSGSSVRSNVAVTGRISGGSVSTPSLTITNLQPSDAANYYITVTNDLGSSTVGPIPLRVRYEPTNLQVTASPDLLQTGNTMTLTCSADAWPAITSYQWTRDGAPGAVISTGAVYTKAQAGPEDYADYRCTVRNAVGAQSATVRPNIQFSPVQNNVGVELVSTPVGGSVTLTCDITANPTPTYTWYRQADVIPGAVTRTYTLQVTAATDFGSYSCSAENSLGILNPAGEFTVQEGDGPDTGASIGGDDGLSTATIILIVIIVIIFLIIVILAIIFCCMQGLCAKWCGKDNKTAKVAPTTYVPPQQAPVYMNGGLVGTRAEPTTKVMLDDDEPNDVDKQFKPLNPGAIIAEMPSWAIISVPEGNGPRAHYLPPLTTDNENVDNYYREERRRSRKKRKHRRHRQADDKDALTGADATEGANGTGSPDLITPGRTGDLESSRNFGRASENVYEN